MSSQTLGGWPPMARVTGRADRSAYVELAVTLGVARGRINTIVDFAGTQRYEVKMDGSAAGASTRDTRIRREPDRVR
jgi:hypothetical protein